MVLTGLTKLKLGDVFKDMPNVTIATSSGLLYSWGESIRSVDDDTVEEDGHEATGKCAIHPLSFLHFLTHSLQEAGCASGAASTSTSTGRLFETLQVCLFFYFLHNIMHPG